MDQRLVPLIGQVPVPGTPEERRVVVADQRPDDPQQPGARPGLQRGHRAQQADQLLAGRHRAPPVRARRPGDGGGQLRARRVLVPDATGGEPGQQLLPLPRRAEGALQRLPRAEDALALIRGPGIGIGVCAGGARTGSAGAGRACITGVGGIRGQLGAGRAVVFWVLPWLLFHPGSPSPLLLTLIIEYYLPPMTDDADKGLPGSYTYVTSGTRGARPEPGRGRRQPPG